MYSKILVPVDGSATSAAGLDEGIRLAKELGSELCVMHIVNEFIFDETWTPGRYSANLFEALREGGKNILDEAERVAKEQGVRTSRIMVESIGGAAADRILEKAAEWHADVIVMGTHGRRGIFRLAMGSDAEQVVRGAHIPVILVRGESSGRKPILAPAFAA